jgi:hypothetical protein
MPLLRVLADSRLSWPNSSDNLVDAGGEIVFRRLSA